MQRRDLHGQRLFAAFVVDHVVGGAQALAAACLAGDDGIDFRRGQSAARGDSMPLGRFAAIDDQDAPAVVAVASGFDQQGHHEHDVRADGGGATAARFFSDHRVQQGLQLFFCFGVGKNEAAHGRTIQSAIGAQDAGAESGAQGRNRGAARRGQFMRDGVGIDDVDAERGKFLGNRALAAADAAGESDDEHRLRDCSSMAGGQRSAASSQATAGRGGDKVFAEARAASTVSAPPRASTVFVGPS